METYNYDFLNLYNAYREPSTVHCSDSYIVRYFTRYLFQKAISVFDWQGMPEHWSKDFFLYVLYARGYLAITDVPGYGPIPQNCSLMGRNIFYQLHGYKRERRYDLYVHDTRCRQRWKYVERIRSCRQNDHISGKNLRLFA